MKHIYTHHNRNTQSVDKHTHTHTHQSNPMDPLPSNPQHSYRVKYGYARFSEDNKIYKDDVTKKLTKFIVELLESESNRNTKSIKLALEHYIQILLPPGTEEGGGGATSPPTEKEYWVSVWRGSWDNYIKRGKTYFGVRIVIFNQACILLFAEYKSVPSLTTLGTIAVAQNKIMFKLDLELEIPRTLAIEVEKCIDWIQDVHNIGVLWNIYEYLWMI